MPLGLQLVARPFGEAMLLRVAHALEEASGALEPPLSARPEAWPSRLSATRAHTDELRGIGYALAAMLMFGLMDAASKYLSTRYPTAQIVWLRFVFTIPMALLLLPPRTALAAAALRQAGVAVDSLGPARARDRPGRLVLRAYAARRRP